MTTSSMAGASIPARMSLPPSGGSRLTEDGIHQWFQGLKRQANHEEWELIAALSFHDLRHDFAHRAREAGWTKDSLAYYLGHVTMKGTPAIGTTVR